MSRHATSTRLFWRSASCIVVAILMALSISLAPVASARTLSEVRDEISSLEDEIASYEEESARLAAQASSLENQIAILQNQQATLRKQIELKEAEHEQILLDIEETTERITQNSETIGYAIAQYYYNSEVTTLERLASSDSFSSYIDEEVSLSSMSDTLSNIVTENKNLKEQLEKDRAEAESILEDLSSQKAQLAASEAEQATLLAQTKESYADYQSKTAAAKSEKEKLEDEQAKIIAAEAAKHAVSNVTAGDANKGGYPYSSKCPGLKDAYADPWGMYICECVSYTAWRVYNRYGYMPYWGGKGNAKQWPANARAAGYTVTNTPKAGYVGISTAGAYGHAVWVEAVSGNRVYISQYNYRNAATNYLGGQYSEQWIDADAYIYIDFGSK